VNVFYFYYRTCLLEFPAAFVGCLLLFWTYSMKPHGGALEAWGARMVTPSGDPEFGEKVPGEFHTAMAFLRRHAPRQYDLVNRHIRIIFINPFKMPRRYYRLGRIFLLSPCNISVECPEGTRPIVMAGLLVSAATFASLKWEEHKLQNIEDECQLAQEQVVQRLADILCDPL
jgi:hypothetical protein